ncbi:hypothetical protein [uncultured Roseobacter sp.]|uniref:hypothetical protein n=1 Tax=uncultured Roseobacter sp. TaxID=114847 RepID=UPI0026032530|nr:hypothetical protein [uncultured Roseobacter sp.]
MRRILITLWLLVLPGIGFATDIQPESGTWSGEVTFDSQTGCPAEMVGQMKQARQGYTGQQITFPDPFGPAVFEDIDPNFTWQKIAPNIWEGIFSDVQQTAIGTMTVVSKSIMVIIAPDQINQLADLTVDLPQSMATSMGMATTTCLVRSTVYHKRTGP